jgi:hypothetical protein
MFRRLPFVSVPNYAPLCLDSNDPDTVQHAFQQRLMRDLPVANSHRLEEFRIFVHDYVAQNFTPVRAMDFEDWLDSTSYNTDRKNQLRVAHESNRGSHPSAKMASHVDTFVKSESYGTWKPARMINSRHDTFKAWSGPLFKAIEEEVYKIPEFIKHIPVVDRPRVIADIRKAGRRYFQTDFTAYESHFVPELMNICECELYRRCLSNYKDVEFLCSTICGKNRMRTRSGIKATLTGRRMSGDMCTSLGNGFTNLMLAKFIAHRKGGDVTGFVEGDDGLFSSSVVLTKEDYAELGFTIKIEEVLDPCAASFCGMVFADSGEIIRDPRRFMENFGWTQSFINAGPTIMEELLRAKALSACYETPQCPIVGALARYALECTKNVSPRFVNDGYHVPSDSVNVVPFCPSHDTRLLFEKLYGISVQVQEESELAISHGDMSALSSLIPPCVEVFDYASKYVVVT